MQFTHRGNAMSKRFYSGKIYTHATGHSCAFRQWKADSHCNLIHGYSLQFEFTFGCDELDDRNWAVDFGGLKELKGWLKYMFDHTYLLASDDPEFQTFQDLADKNLIDLRVVGAVGCERCLLYTSPSPRDLSTSRMPSSA